jgi:hypothetical protein
MKDALGFAIKSSSSILFPSPSNPLPFSRSPACNPSTSRRYSSSNFEASFSFILCVNGYQRNQFRLQGRKGGEWK